MTRIAACLLVAALSAPAHAEIVAASPDHYELKQEAVSAMAPGELWDRLVHPELWWHPDHTYSGTSEHLSLDPKAGGLWKETWDDGSVAHGTVLTVLHGKTLRLDAPAGGRRIGSLARATAMAAHLTARPQLSRGVAS